MSTALGSKLPEMEEEDCSYVLREMELNAFSAVVAAMRAQGVFNKFKEGVLEGVKTALFISDETYKAEMRKAANDEFLMKVATILNPCYDVFTDWGVLGLEAEEEAPVIPQPRYFEGSSTHSVADELLMLASAHNARVEECDVVLAGMLQLPKQPYVPEKLRKLLRDTESLHTERILPPKIEEPEEFTFVEPKMTPKPAAVRRKRKSKANGLKEEDCMSPVPMDTPERLSMPSTSTAAGPPLLSPQKVSTEDQAAAILATHLGFLPSKDAETIGVKEFINKIQQQIEMEQRTAVTEQGTRRKRKPRQTAAQKEGYQECARARPFLFPRYLADGTKPPRGNPDRTPTPRGRSNPPNVAAATTPQQSPVPQAMAPPPVPQASPQHQPQQVAASGLGPSTSHDQAAMPAPPVPKENPVVTVRRLPSPATPGQGPKSNPAVTSTPVAGIYKRPRVASFSEPTAMSPSELAQRAVAKSRVPFLQSVPVAKLKVAARDAPQQQQPAASPPPTRTFYATGLSLASVNRTQVPARTAAGSASAPNLVVPSTSAGPSSSQQQSAPPLSTDEYVSRPIYKRSVYKAPASASVRLAANGTVTVQKPIITPPPAGLIAPSSPVTVVMKKGTPPPGSVPGTSTPNIVTIVRRSPPPSQTGQQQTPNVPSPSNMVNVVRKYNAQPATPNSMNHQMSVGQFLRKAPAQSPTSAGLEPPPAKRLLYCEPSSNVVIATPMQQPNVEYDTPMSQQQTDGAFQSTSSFDPTKYGNTKCASEYGQLPEYIDDGIRQLTSPAQPQSQMMMVNHGYDVVHQQRVYKLQPEEPVAQQQEYVVPTVTQQQPPQQAPNPSVSEGTAPPPPAAERKTVDILQQSMMEIS